METQTRIATQSALTHPDHAAKYEMAVTFCERKTVLDCACGGGFGSDILARVATKVYGIDSDPNVLADANYFYPAANIEFMLGDARKLTLPDNSVDVAISVETIEHFVEQDEFMAELKRVVRPGGTIMITTPDHDVNMQLGVYNSKHRHGHGHPAELTFPQFDALVRKYFSSPEYFGQFFMRGKPGLKHRVVNLAKRLDVFELRRKLFRKKTLDRLNISAHLTDFSSVTIMPRTGLSACMIVVCKNTK
jgi:ubiquinone/menaquinone biosynthesis C-methylase UbiE